jgi:hypothetical protein
MLRIVWRSVVKTLSPRSTAMEIGGYEYPQMFFLQGEGNGKILIWVTPEDAHRAVADYRAQHKEWDLGPVDPIESYKVLPLTAVITFGDPVE